MRANDTVDEKKIPNPYEPEYIGVEKFLDIISLEPTSDKDGERFCLSHVFTYRDFEDGVLGLAWVAEPGKLARQKYLPEILLGEVVV
jgi:disintegrin and metalloproteinase domain-containing protein 10